MDTGLFEHLEHSTSSLLAKPSAYLPRNVSYFKPERIILAKGSRSDPERRAFVRNILQLYPGAEVIEADDTAHSHIEVPGNALLERHRIGKRTLVLAELKTAVRFSEESGNTCPNYWHFSPYGFCPYSCHYCYLAGTVGVKFSPTVKIYLNLPEMLRRIDRIATEHGQPTTFYVGKLQDGLALDPITGYSRIMIPFFARHRYARLTLLTKSDNVENLLDLGHNGHSILSWSLNPASICRAFEVNTAPLEDRLSAMCRCTEAGYPVRAVIMPLIPIPKWQGVYSKFITDLLNRVRLDRITLGGICSYQTARALMNAKLSADNIINRHFAGKSLDGRMRYAKSLRVEMYTFLKNEILRQCPGLTVALCLEEREVWKSVGLSSNMGRCNCVS